MVAKRKKLDYEAAVAELESLVEQLERGDITREESRNLYERGGRGNRRDPDPN